MAITGIALAREALKLFYLPVLQTQFNEKADPLLAQLEMDTTMVVGDDIVMGLRYGKQGGIAALASDIADLPTPNSRKTKQAKWNTKNLFARIMISDKTIEASKSNTGAFMNLLKQELEDAQTDAKDDVSRQVYGDGNGKLATTAAVTAVTVVGVDSVKYLAEGMLVDVCAANGTVKNAGLEITVVNDSASPSVTLSGAVTTANTDILVRAGAYGSEMTGLEKVFTADNILYGVDRSINKWFNAQSIALNGELDEVTIQKGIDDAERLAGAKTKYASTSYGVRRAFQALLSATKQHVNTLDLKGGWKALSYVSGETELAIVGTKYAPTGKMRLLDTDNWKMAQLTDWGFMDADGAMLSRVSGKAAYEATLRKYCDIACALPKGQVEITGITEH